MRKERLQSILFVVILVAAPLIIYQMLAESKFGSRLTYMGPTTVDAEGNTVYHTVAPFSFVDQTGDTITEADVEGKIYIANYFFVACPTICPKMSTQLKRVHQLFKTEERLEILSHTVDPKRDSVPVLAAYAEKYGADASQWHFLTGKKKDIYMMARNSYLVTTLEGDGGPTDFIHSELLVLVDQHRHVRGTYDGTEPSDVDMLIEDVERLLADLPDDGAG